MRVVVAPVHLADASGAIRAAGHTVVGSTTDLDTLLGPLAASCTGEAATAYAGAHARWQSAAAGLVATLSELAAHVGTAHGNYIATIAANRSIWGSPAGRGTEGVSAETDDIRAAVRALVPVADGLTAAWTGLASGLGPFGATAGGDAVGVALATDHDAMAGAVWQGWRSALVVLGATLGGIAATGNNIIVAEHESMPTPRPPEPELIADAAVPMPAPVPPPSAAGDSGPRTWHTIAPVVSNYWPRANPEALVAVGRPWKDAREAVLDAAGRARSTITALADTNPDPALEDLRTFAGALFTADPAAGLFGVLALANGRVAEACRLLAEKTEQTRRLIPR